MRQLMPAPTAGLSLCIFLLLCGSGSVHGDSQAGQHHHFIEGCAELEIASLRWGCNSPADSDGRLQTVQGGCNSTIRLCQSSAHSSQAILAIREPGTPGAHPDTHSVFRVRVVGPQVLLVHMTQCGHGLYLGHLHVLGVGQYTVEVLRTFSNFSIFSWEVTQEAQHIANMTFQVVEQPGGATLDDGSWSITPNTPICNTFPLQGIWVSRRPTDPLITALRTTLVKDDSRLIIPPPLGAQYNDDILQWRPKQGCRLLTWPELAQRGCLKNRHICFVGDSQVRNLHNGWSTNLHKILAGQPEPTTGAHPDNSAVKEVVPGNHSSYFIDVWGNLTRVHQLQQCTDVVTSIGHWPMSLHGKPPWTLKMYADRIDSHLGELARLKSQNKRVFWMTMHAFPYLQAFGTGPLTVDRRVEPWMYLYNQAANKAVRKHGVLLFNTWGLTNTLVDTSYDMNHHAINGSVGVALSRYFHHYLCHVAMT